MLMREQFSDQNLIIWSVDVPYGSSFYLVIYWSMVLLFLLAPVKQLFRCEKVLLMFLRDADKRERKDLQKAERGE
jgi:hypothetical protein